MINLTTDEFNRQLVSFVAENAATCEIEVVTATGEALELDSISSGVDDTVSDWLDENQITLADFDDLTMAGAVSVRSSAKHGNQIVTINRAVLEHIISQG